jgi:hypothetical protein
VSENVRLAHWLLSKEVRQGRMITPFLAKNNLKRANLHTDTEFLAHKSPWIHKNDTMYVILPKKTENQHIFLFFE